MSHTANTHTVSWALVVQTQVQTTRLVTIRYDTIVEFNLDSKAECDQLNLAHETKTNKRQYPVSSVQVQDP